MTTIETLTQTRVADPRRSAFLVFAQVGLSAAIVIIQPWPSGELSISLVVVAIALWLWAVSELGFSRLTVQPAPRSDAQLVTTGPYRFVRHPMYLALLVFCSGFVAAQWSWLSAGLWLLLAGVLNQKAAIEEDELERKYPLYGEYQRKSSRFLPGIY